MNVYISKIPHILGAFYQHDVLEDRVRFEFDGAGQRPHTTEHTD